MEINYVVVQRDDIVEIQLSGVAYIQHDEEKLWSPGMSLIIWNLVQCKGRAADWKGQYLNN